MQNTRLNNLASGAISQLSNWFLNPWRRVSLIIISLLWGFFFSTAVATTIGQTGRIDIIAAAILLLFTEVVSRITYGRKQKKRSLWLDTLNALKVGLTYGLYVEAFKLGS